MKPTYSFIEIKQMLPSLDAAELDLLLEVSFDEKDRFTSFEFRAIYRMIMISKKKLAQNAVQMDYLLFFN